MLTQAQSEPSWLEYDATLDDALRAVVVLGGRTHYCARASFRGFLLLQRALRSLPERPAQALRLIFEACGIDDKEWPGYPISEVLRAAVRLLQFNALRGTLPVLLAAEEVKNTTPLAWDYPGRESIQWIHVLAKTYGWAEQVILDMHPEAVLCFVHEALVREQLDKEWNYSLTRLAYDKSGKYRALPRPKWMVRPKAPVKKIKYRKDLLPIGTVVNLDELVKTQAKAQNQA